MLNVNDVAPNFSLPYETGKDINLSDFKGKKVVLYFYPKDDTPGCTIEAQDFSRLAEEFAKYNTIIIGVSKDSLTCHDKFKKKYNLNLMLASDEESIVCKLYDVIGEKSMFGKKYMGILRTSFLIDENGKIIKIWQNVKVDNHAAEILKVIESL